MADLGAQMQQPMSDQHRHVRTPSRAVGVEQDQVEIPKVIQSGMNEAGVIPQLAGPVVGHLPIEEADHAVGVALAVGTGLDRPAAWLLRMRYADVGSREHPGRPARGGCGQPAVEITRP